MKNSWDAIVTYTRLRQRAGGPLLNQMIQVKERYNGDWVLPGFEELGPLTPAIIADAIDHTAMRAASVMPAIQVPALDPTKDTGVRSVGYANIRRKALAATWHQSKWSLGSRRAFRHLAGYATCSLVVKPDILHECVKVEVRDPLTSYPDAKAPEDLSPPTNVAFVTGKSAADLRRRFPQCMKERGGPVPADRGALDEIWDVVEWWDEDEMVLGILGPRYWDNGAHQILMSGAMELYRAPNRAGMVPAVIPQRVTLDRIASQVANIVGITDLMARLMALDILATERSIFPDRYIIGNDSNTPELVGGQWKDGRSGEVNLILNASAVGDLRGAPDPTNKQTIAQLERNAKQSSGLVPQFGGEAGSGAFAMRTGRGVGALMEAAVDPRVQELQDIMAAALPHVNEAIFESYKGYWGGKKYTMFTGWSGDNAQVDFVPDTHFETNLNTVVYPIPGADIQTTTVALGQMLGAKAISQRSFRRRHPWVDDAEAEEKEILAEDMERALADSLGQRAAAGEIPPRDMAQVILELRRTGDIAQATIVADELASERQAQQAPEPAAGMAADPMEMPGLANPGTGAESAPPAAPVPEIAGPRDAQANLRRLTLALRAGSAR